MARYRAGPITRGALTQADGVRLIRDAARERGGPAESADAVRRADGWEPSPYARDDIRTGIVRAAARLFAG